MKFIAKHLLVLAIVLVPALGAATTTKLGDNLPSEIPSGFDSWPEQIFPCKFSPAATRETRVFRKREGERLTIVAVSRVKVGNDYREPHMVIYKDNSVVPAVNAIFYNDSGAWRKFDQQVEASKEEIEVSKRMFEREGLPLVAPAHCS